MLEHLGVKHVLLTVLTVIIVAIIIIVIRIEIIIIRRMITVIIIVIIVINKSNENNNYNKNKLNTFFRVFEWITERASRLRGLTTRPVLSESEDFSETQLQN